jgi:hypothetical protein
MAATDTATLLERFRIILNHSDGMWRGASQGVGRSAMRCIGQDRQRCERPPHATPSGPALLSLGGVELLDRGSATLCEALLTQAQKDSVRMDQYYPEMLYVT